MKVLLTQCLQAMDRANGLIHIFRNEPGQVNNFAVQVDPVIQDLRVAIAALERRLGPMSDKETLLAEIKEELGKNSHQETKDGEMQAIWRVLGKLVKVVEGETE